MGFEQLVQRAVDLEAVEKIADAAECLDFAAHREPNKVISFVVWAQIHHTPSS